MSASWKVENGVFIGEVLCDRREDQELESLGVKVESEEHWLPACIDLRGFISIRKRGYAEDAGLTVMEGFDEGLMYTVDAPIEGLMPHFIASRK